jgi:type III secretory pathway component EscS
MKYVARALLIILLLPVLIVTGIFGILMALRQDEPDWKEAFNFHYWIITGK